MINYAESQASWYYRKLIENRFLLEFGYGMGDEQSEKIFSEQFEYWSKNETVDPEILANIIESADRSLKEKYAEKMKYMEEREKLEKEDKIIRNILAWGFVVIATLILY